MPISSAAAFPLSSFTSLQRRSAALPELSASPHTARRISSSRSRRRGDPRAIAGFLRVYQLKRECARCGGAAIYENKTVAPLAVDVVAARRQRGRTHWTVWETRALRVSSGGYGRRAGHSLRWFGNNEYAKTSSPCASLSTKRGVRFPATITARTRQHLGVFIRTFLRLPSNIALLTSRARVRVTPTVAAFR